MWGGQKLVPEGRTFSKPYHFIFSDLVDIRFLIEKII
jgi:hypothetical protein